MTSISANKALLISVASRLNELLEQLVFVGGCTTELFITDQIKRSPRPTKDVDTIVQVASRVEYQKLSQALRDKGFTEDTTMGAPLCRWCYQDTILDVMPTTVVSVFIDKKATLFDQFLLQPLFVSSRIARVLVKKLRFSTKTEITVMKQFWVSQTVGIYLPFRPVKPIN